jgi:bis(5'-nucleosidyl)-tetraphosphatase
MHNIQIKQKISCGIIPVFKNNQGKNEFLVVELHHGGISFPKGHREGNETYLQTAERELFEETGLVCYNIDREFLITESYTITRPDKIIYKTVYYYIGCVDTQQVIMQPEEIKNYFWGTAEPIMKKINHVESREVFKKALDHLGSCF